MGNREWDAGWRAALVVCAVAVLAAPSGRPSAQACPVPRPTLWASVRDSLWPLIAHREGDERWAHLEPAGLPGPSAAWCNPLANDPQARRAGHDLFVQYCAACHGAQGRGDGLSAGVSDPPPYDFTRPEFAGMREPPGPAVLYAILTRGIDGTSMRGHAQELSGWERLAVLAWITGLPGDSAVRRSREFADTLRLRRP